MAADLFGVPLLIVDDHGDSAEMLAELLAEEGAEVRTAPNAEEALEMTASFTPRVLLLDIEMPLMDGFELLRLLRLRPALHAVPAVAVTAYAYPQDKQRARSAGFDAYVTKPVDFDELIACLSSLVQRPFAADPFEARLAAVLDRTHSEHDMDVRSVVEPLRAALSLASEIPSSLVGRVDHAVASLESIVDDADRKETHVQRLSVDVAEILVDLYRADQRQNARNAD